MLQNDFSQRLNDRAGSAKKENELSRSRLPETIGIVPFVTRANGAGRAIG
jgi:hypothetical protein